jgi:hypothetical protein
LLRNSQQPGATRDFARVYLSPFSPMKSGYSWIVPSLASALLKPSQRGRGLAQADARTKLNNNHEKN